MALHVRYTDGRHNDTRIQVKFTRLDLLWQTHEPLTSPFTGHTLAGLPVLVEDNLVVGPTILDMMMRTANGRLTAAEALGHREFVMTRLYESA